MPHIYHAHGFSGFMTGYLPMTLRTTPFAIGLISLRDFIHRRSPNDAVTALTTAAILQTATLPLDYYSILRQANPGIPLKIKEVFQTLVQKRRLSLGLGNRILGSTIEFFIFYKLLDFLG